MIQEQQKSVSLYCPRCGGLMYKPVGSTLYWHADNRHPRCNITNIRDTVLETLPSSPSAVSPPSAKGL